MTPDRNKYLVLKGIYKDNHIYSPNAEPFFCTTYNSLRQKIEGKEGFHHLQWEKDIFAWGIFQSVLLCEAQHIDKDYDSDDE